MYERTDENKWDKLQRDIQYAGFTTELSFEFDSRGTSECAILYFQPVRGLIIWVTSSNNKTDVHGAELIGQVSFEGETLIVVEGESVETEEFRNSYSTLVKMASTVSPVNTEEYSWRFIINIRAGVLGLIQELEEDLKFVNPWTSTYMPWLLTYSESSKPSNEREQIIIERIKQSSNELQSTLHLFLEKQEEPSKPGLLKRVSSWSSFFG